MWLRDEIPREEEGAEKWSKFVQYVNTPPEATPLTPEPVRQPSAPSRAAQIRAAAESAVGDQAAAFAAYIES